MEQPTEVVRVKVSKKTLKALRKYAAETERTISASIRLAINQLLEKEKK